MKVITNLQDLKKGDTVIIKDNLQFENRGLMKVTGDVFDIDFQKPHFTIKCIETAEIERINFADAKVFLIDGH